MQDSSTEVIQQKMQLFVLSFKDTDAIKRTRKGVDMKHYGLIAQEAEKIFPEVVTHNKLDGGGDYYTMDYTAYGVLAIKAIQEQQKKITDPEDRLAKLETALASVAPGKVSSATSIVKDA